MKSRKYITRKQWNKTPRKNKQIINGQKYLIKYKGMTRSFTHVEIRMPRPKMYLKIMYRILFYPSMNK